MRRVIIFLAAAIVIISVIAMVFGSEGHGGLPAGWTSDSMSALCARNVGPGESPYSDNVGLPFSYERLNSTSCDVSETNNMAKVADGLVYLSIVILFSFGAVVFVKKGRSHAKV